MAHDDCFGDNATFRRESVRGRILMVRRAEDGDPLRACLADLEGTLARARLHKDSRSTKAGTLVLADGREIFIKRYNRRGLRDTLRYLFRRARPFRAWAAAWACERHGIPTPRPLAAMVERHARILCSAWLVRLAVPHPVPTLTYAEQVLRQPRIRADFTTQVCVLMARMHAAGIVHGDLKLSNIYACRDDGGFRYGVWDLDGTTLVAAPADGSVRAAELARVVASLVDIAARLGRPVRPEPLVDAFLAAYAEADGGAIAPSSVLKPLWRHLRT
jgi:hypothetical protein